MTISDRFALLMAIWALPPRHPVVRFLSGSSEVPPLSPEALEADLEVAREAAESARQEIREIFVYLEDEMDAPEEVLNLLRRASEGDYPEPSEEEALALRKWGERLARGPIG